MDPNIQILTWLTAYLHLDGEFQTMDPNIQMHTKVTAYINLALPLQVGCRGLKNKDIEVLGTKHDDV